MNQLNEDYQKLCDDAHYLSREIGKDPDATPKEHHIALYANKRAYDASAERLKHFTDKSDGQDKFKTRHSDGDFDQAQQALNAMRYHSKNIHYHAQHI